MNRKKIVLDLKERYNLESATLLLILLVIGDFAFFIVDIINKLFDLENHLFSLDIDGSYPEFYQYMKWLWISFMFIYLSKKWQTINFTLWGLFFIYLLFDDALGIHENVGGKIAESLSFSPPFGLRLQDIGELAVTAVAGTTLFSLLFIAFIVGSQEFRGISVDIFLLILLLVVFGVFIDMLDIALPLEGKAQRALWFIEDGGEMLVASIICWYVFLMCIIKKDKTINFSLTILSAAKSSF